jgi:hypothetical protein
MQNSIKVLGIICLTGVAVYAIATWKDSTQVSDSRTLFKLNAECTEKYSAIVPNPIHMDSVTSNYGVFYSQKINDCIYYDITSQKYMGYELSKEEKELGFIPDKSSEKLIQKTSVKLENASSHKTVDQYEVSKFYNNDEIQAFTESVISKYK